MTIEGNFETGAKADAIEVITTDHRVVEQLLTQVEAAAKPEDTELRRDLGGRIVHELTVHMTIEEQVLYPAVRRYVDDGDDLADRAVAEHQTVKDLLGKLAAASPDDAGYLAGFAELEASVAQHVHEEERELLPQLRESVRGEKLYELGDELLAAKASAAA
jgi:hemerythrin superfamily protein